jgi:two-component system, NarL family, response regulator DegU
MADARRSPEPARVVVVDDHDSVREGLKEMLADVPDIRVVGEAANGREAVELCDRELPNLMLMDVRMPRMDGLAATREIKREHPETSVLMVTMHEHTDYLLEALQAGAAGYVLKDATRQELIAAIRRVLSGESPLDPELAARLLRRLASDAQASTAGGGHDGTRPQPQRAALAQPLTPRELEVLALLALGRTNREIAEEFVVSVGTVKNHVEHLIAKLGASDRTHAVVRSLELGIISFPSQ